MWPSFLAVGPAGLEVTLSHPAGGIDHLHHIDELLKGHDGERDAGDDPGPGALELVGTGHLEGTGAPWAGEETGRLRVGGVSGLSGGGLGFRDGLQERGRQNGRGEGEKVEADEESLVESAADEQDGLSEGAD